jgi:mRNA interferase YafQ
MYKIKKTSDFKKGYKRAKKRGCNLELLKEVIDNLKDGKTLDPKYKDHDLHGNWEGFRECHITSDWLLIYKIYDDVMVIVLTETGTLSDLFR